MLGALTKAPSLSAGRAHWLVRIVDYVQGQQSKEQPLACDRAQAAALCRELISETTPEDAEAIQVLVCGSDWQLTKWY